MNSEIKLLISVSLLIISMLGNAWLAAERQQISEVKSELKELTFRLERLTATVGVLAVILKEHSGVDIPPPYGGH